MSKKLKCALSEKSCKECETQANCVVYSERCVLNKQLKKLKKNLGDLEVIISAILNK